MIRVKPPLNSYSNREVIWQMVCVELKRIPESIYGTHINVSFMIFVKHYAYEPKTSEDLRQEVWTKTKSHAERTNFPVVPSFSVPRWCHPICRRKLKMAMDWSQSSKLRVLTYWPCSNHVSLATQVLAMITWDRSS